MTDASRVLDPVVEFADTVLEHGRDEYGSERTPLFVDSLDARTKEPATHDTAHRIRRDHPDAVLSNPATQQAFFRTLAGLSRLTGERRYREAAEESMRYVFEELTDDAGLVRWGGHVAYDLESDEPAAWRMYHELKCHFPFYELFWKLDPGATRDYVEAFWNAHVRDWATLDFDRHGRYGEPMGPLWDHDYEGGSVFFLGEGLTFKNTGSDLYYAAATLADLTGDDAPLAWADRLARRYLATRQGEDVTGYQFSSQRGKPADERQGACNLEGDRAEYQMGPFVHGDRLVREGTLFKPMPQVQRRNLLLGERLGDRCETFTEWALAELRAWGEVAYRPGSNTFEPMLIDGFSMEGFVQRLDGYYGERGTVVEPITGHPDFLWAYAHAYRVSGETYYWEVARHLARGNGLGDVGSPDGRESEVSTDTGCSDYHAIYGLLDLYRATGREPLLDLANRVAANLVEERYRDGLFLAGDGEVGLVGDPAPFALVHLAAANEGSDPATLPAPGGTKFGSSAGGGF